jgi:hypothetical protein
MYLQNRTQISERQRMAQRNTYSQTTVQQKILYTNKHCDIKHIINARFLFPFISNSATLSHSDAWLGRARARAINSVRTSHEAQYISVV